MVKLEDLIGMTVSPKEDHSSWDYIQDDKQLAIYMSGHYTVAELKMKLRCLCEANQLTGQEEGWD